MAEKKLDYDAIMDILTNEEKERNKDRRQKRDWITRMPVILSLMSWAILAVVWVILDIAAPDKRHGWLSFFEVNFGSTIAHNPRWDKFLVNISYILLMVSIGICFIAFGFNRMRKRRKTDKYKLSVFFVGVISIIALTSFLIFFLPKNIIGNWW